MSRPSRSTDGESAPRALVERLAAACDLRTVRFARVPPGPSPHLDLLDDWLARGFDADMAWIRRGRDARADPRTRLAGARSAAVFAVEHASRPPPDPGGRTGFVARFAWGRDYHLLVGKRLERLRKALRAEGIAAWGGVDTAPVLERAWASAAGLGFGGKSGAQILPGRTSWFSLAVLFLDIEVEPDEPAHTRCGACRRCIDACPTGAIAAPHLVDSRRCIAYWTIESRDLAPPPIREATGRRFFGCDACQEACPHNRAPPEDPEPDPAPRNAWIDLDEVLRTPDDALVERFRGTPLRRCGAAGLKRNALVVLANLADPEALPLARDALAHPSPTVRAAAEWCLERLGAAPRRDTDP